MAKVNKIYFPMMNEKNWWILRAKFKSSIPGVVTDSYLSAVLGIQNTSARNNILPYLKSIGIIDEECKTQPLARKWRDDKLYPKVCKELLHKIYPEELISTTKNPREERNIIKSWFASNTGTGTAAVGRMVNFYLLLFEADLSKKILSKTPKKNKNKKTNKSITSKKANTKTKPSIDIPNTNITHNNLNTTGPELNINLEIHISSDATPDQIDKIFESMARHIYKK